MLNKNHIRIQHMLDAANEATSFIKNRTRDDLNDNRLLTLALTKSIEIIGEAANHVDIEMQKKFSDIPWNDVIGMRNRLVHGYYDIDLDRVWDTLTDDLPPLIDELQDLIGKVSNCNSDIWTSWVKVKSMPTLTLLINDWGTGFITIIYEIQKENKDNNC